MVTSREAALKEKEAFLTEARDSFDRLLTAEIQDKLAEKDMVKFEALVRELDNYLHFFFNGHYLNRPAKYY
jgi:hypothetical protein